MNEEIMKALGFGKQMEEIKRGLCPLCSKSINVTEFKDEESIVEYKISGLCQSCQDIIWEGGNYTG